MGKTSNACRFPKHLLLAAERGYNAIPGAMVQPIDSWSDFKKVLRELKKPEVQERFETIILDTIDLFADYCEKYILNNAPRPDGGFGVDKISDIPYGQGYGMIEKEFDECLRKIVQMNYGLILISHATDKTFTDERGQEYNQIVPTLDKRATKVCSRMVDIIGYSKTTQDEQGNLSTKLYMRGTPRYLAGSRFTYLTSCINFTYDDLVKAIHDAIDKEEAESDSKFFTSEKNNLYAPTETLDFDELMNTFNSMIKEIADSCESEYFASYWQPRIIEITDKILGKGNKVNDCSRNQTEALDLIVMELKDLVEQSKETK